MDRDEVIEWQDQVFELVRRGSEAVLDAGRVVADSVTAVLPGESERVEGIVDTAFDVGERFLRGQREVVREVVDVIVARIPDGEGDGAV